MFNAREFTKRGFIRREDLDFADDGNRFKGYEYKGMPITYLRCKDNVRVFNEELQQWTYTDEEEYRCFINVRVDYITNEYDFNIYDLLNTDWYRDCDRFNDVNEDVVDLEELKQIVDRAWEGIADLEEKVKAEYINRDELQIMLTNEMLEVTKFIDMFKANFDCFDKTLSDYRVKSYIDYVHSVEHYLERGNDTDFSTMNLKDVRRMKYSKEEYGYFFINMKHNFYIEQMREYLTEKGVI